MNNNNNYYYLFCIVYNHTIYYSWLKLIFGDGQTTPSYQSVVITSIYNYKTNTFFISDKNHKLKAYYV